MRIIKNCDQIDDLQRHSKRTRKSLIRKRQRAVSEALLASPIGAALDKSDREAFLEAFLTKDPTKRMESFDEWFDTDEYWDNL